MSIEWYLKYKLKSHFVNESHSFVVRDESMNEFLTCFGDLWTNEFEWKNDVLWPLSYNYNPVSLSEVEEETEDESSYTYIYAPAIVSTINYNQDDYIRDINYIVSQFMTNFNKIKIIIVNKQ